MENTQEIKTFNENYEEYIKKKLEQENIIKLDREHKKELLNIEMSKEEFNFNSKFFDLMDNPKFMENFTINRQKYEEYDQQKFNLMSDEEFIIYVYIGRFPLNRDIERVKAIDPEKLLKIIINLKITI